MCLIVFAWRAHPDYRLVLAANRDEFHVRPSQALHFWPDNPDVLAGRDLQAGGTWLAAHRGGRFATVTNYREQQRTGGKLASRGALVTDFVTSDENAGSFSAAIEGKKYAGFSLLTADDDDLYYVSNRGDPALCLEAGIYGLSNASLDTPWPKVRRSREAMSQLLESNTMDETALYRLMSDRTRAAVSDVDDKHLPFELARALTAPFIVTPDYGTRCSTVMLWSNDGKIVLGERRFDAAGNLSGKSSFSFVVRNSQPTAP